MPPLPPARLVALSAQLQLNPKVVTEVFKKVGDRYDGRLNQLRVEARRGRTSSSASTTRDNNTSPRRSSSSHLSTGRDDVLPRMSPPTTTSEGGEGEGEEAQPHAPRAARAVVTMEPFTTPPRPEK